MSRAPLIGLYSPAPGSGKSTLAHAMRGYGWRTLKFAAPLKAMLAALMREVGESEPTIMAALEGGLKGTPLPVLANRTPRHAMQTLGTEWGRDQIAQDFWVRLFLLRAERLRTAGIPVICDDMRFPNEAEAIRSVGGKIVRIDRPSVIRETAHASEGGLDGTEFDFVITNDAACATAFETEWAPRLAAFGQQEMAV